MGQLFTAAMLSDRNSGPNLAVEDYLSYKYWEQIMPVFFVIFVYS